MIISTSTYYSDMVDILNKKVTVLENIIKQKNLVITNLDEWHKKDKEQISLLFCENIALKEKIGILEAEIRFLNNE